MNIKFYTACPLDDTIASALFLFRNQDMAAWHILDVMNIMKQLKIK